MSIILIIVSNTDETKLYTYNLDNFNSANNVRY